MSDFCFKIIECNNDRILAIADRELVGKRYEEGDIVLDVRESFYSEKEISSQEKDMEEIFRGVTIINAVGKNIIELLVKNNFINEKNVLYVNGVPHAQVVLL